MLQRFRCAARTKNVQACIWKISRREKWKALCVVVMQVTEEQQQFQSALLLNGAFCQLTSQRNDARAGIQNDRAPARVDFHTSGIPAIFDRPRAGCGITSAHTPEFDFQFIVHGSTSVSQVTVTCAKRVTVTLYALLSLLQIFPQGKFSQHGWEICHTTLFVLRLRSMEELILFTHD